MREHFEAKRYDEALAAAQMAAPYIHPKLNATSLSIKPPSQMTDAELEFALAQLDAMSPIVIEHDDQDADGC